MDNDKFYVQAINRHKLGTDGKGVTTLVGLYACPLKCRYCLNKNVLSIDKYKILSPEELYKKVMIDYCYFLSTGGGITFGGGESLIYEEQILKFIDLLPEGVNVNLETSLNYECDDLQMLCEKVNHFIIDIKSWNDSIYEKYTGRSSELMKKNIDFIISNHFQNKCKIRIPVIPEFTTKEDAIQNKKIIESFGFSEIEIFDYVIRDYMLEE